MKLLRGIAALVALLALLVGVPTVLVLTVGNPWPPGGLTELELASDRVVVGLLAVLAWVFWAQMTVCIAVETPAAISGRTPPPRVWLTSHTQQRLARVLVHSVVAIAFGSATLTSGLSPAHGQPSPPATSSTPIAVASAASEPPAASDHVVARDPQASNPAQRPRHDPAAPTTVTVAAGDTLWGLAERHLGAGERWREIADLNTGHPMGQGRTFRSGANIDVGWTLLMPPNATDLQSSLSPRAQTRSQVQVVPGDTLSGLAEDELGDATEWPEIYDLNRDIVADPDLIFPGQILDLTTPDRSTPQPDPTPPPTEPETPSEKPGPQPPRTSSIPDPGAQMPPRATEPTARPDAPGPEAATQPNTDSPAVEDGDGLTGLRALLASGICLAGGAFGLLVANRRRQVRQRRPGRCIAATPVEVVAVERAVVEAGTPALETTVFVDRALRAMAAAQRQTASALPDVGALILDHHQLLLLLNQPTPGLPPPGWEATDDHKAWTLPRDAEVEDHPQQPAPYPGLVSVGTDTTGHTWMLDLESSATVRVGIEGNGSLDVVRYLVAELGLNPWSEGAEILVPGDLSDLAHLAPHRISVVTEAQARQRLACLDEEPDHYTHTLGKDLLELRRDADAADSTNPVIVVVATPSAAAPPEDQHPVRSRVVVVDHDTDDTAPMLVLTGDGSAFLPAWGATVNALTLTTTDACVMGDLMKATRRLDDEPVPDAPGQGPVGHYATADGALRAAHTTPRDPRHQQSSSLLPDPDDGYLKAGATTTEDLAALAPCVPDSVRADLGRLDPELDTDLGAWRDPDSARPRVHVLGPVGAEAMGGSVECIAHLGGTIEFIVYVACQDRGATPERAAEALGWAVRTTHNRANDARKLLGRTPQGAEWLPESSKSPTARVRGVATYQLAAGVLVDADLFRRLRLRAQSRGRDGLSDLVDALSLVGGRPFDQQRRGGYGWLIQGDPIDHHLTHGVVDVAHLIVSRALTDDDTGLARWACEIAIGACPDSDVARLDLAAVVAAEAGSADDVVREQVLDRTDADPTPRTEKVLDQRGWLAS